MKLFIKDKFLSLHRNMHILDENNQPYLLVEGKLFSPTHKRVVKDKNGVPLFYVRRKFFHLLPKAYIYDSEHTLYAKIKKKFGFKQNFDITGFLGDINVEGSIFAWNFSIYQDGNLIGTIQRRMDVLVDSFELEVIHPENAAFLVAFVAAIDNIYDSKSK